MVKKQKFLKNLLTSVSVASIVASIGGSSSAFAANFDVGAAIALSATAAANNDTAIFNDVGGGVLTVDALDNININAEHDGTVTLRKPFTITGIADNGNITINVGGHALVLTGSANTSVTLNGGRVTGNVGHDVTFAAGGGMVTGDVGHDVTFAAGGRVTGTVRGNVTVGAGRATIGRAIAGGVTFGGTGTLTATGGVDANVDFAGYAGIIVLGDNQAIGGNVTNVGAAAAGTLTFAGVGRVNGDIGAADNAAAGDRSLATINIGDGEVHLQGDVFATTTQLTNVNSVLKLAIDKTINGAVRNTTGAAGANGVLTFEGAGVVTGNIGANGTALLAVNIGDGEVHLQGNVYATNTNLTHADSVLKLAATKKITGAITTANNNQGTLIFEGAGEVTGNIGAVGHALDIINLQAGNITLKGDVFTQNLNYYTKAGVAADGKTVTIKGNFTGKVDFSDAKANILTFNGDAGPYTFASAIEHGNNGTLNVQTDLVATNADIGKIKTINIGTANNNAVLTIAATNADVALLGNVAPVVNQEIKFLDVNSQLKLRTNNGGDRIITFNNDLPGFAGGGGVVTLEGTNNHSLTVQSAGGDKTLGINGNELTRLEVRGKVTVKGEAGVSKLDISNTLVLNIINGATFTDESCTSAKIPEVHIGKAFGTTLVGAASYILDAKHGPVDILAAGKTIKFSHADARLILRNSAAAANRTITLQNDLDPGAKNTGIVEFDSVNNGAELKIDGGKNLGTAGHKLKKVIFSGAGSFDINATLNTASIELNTNAVVTLGTRGVINSDIIFSKDTTLNAQDTINGNVNFNNKNATIKLADKKEITGTITGGGKGTLEFQGDGAVGATNLKLLKAGAGNVTLATGTYTIGEIQGNGLKDLTFASGFNLTGGINLTAGGQEVGLIFQGDGKISGNVGSVGNIKIQKGTVKFDGSIRAKNIIISDKAIAEIAGNVNANAINGAGKVKFNNQNDIVINSAMEIENVEIAGGNVSIKDISEGKILFSGSKNTTLTLKEESTVSNITTTGNNLHSLALNADLTITGAVGTGSNKLKEIKLLGDHKLIITKSNFYAAVSTQTNNSGEVIFDSEDSIAYGTLGTEKLRLSDVIFDNNSTVKSDIYSKKITINPGKTATFAGTEERAIDISQVDVGGTHLARLLEKFTYHTKIGSENIEADSSSKIKFGNAALINAPINGGQVILEDNVWFTEKVKSAAVTFAPNKYAILETDIISSKIEANQAKLIILAEKQLITGDLAAKDLTIDLGANQFQYTGNAKLTGTLELNTFYDTSKMAGGNIEIQDNSKLDLSKLDKLVVKVKARSDINKISEDTKYAIITSVDKDGITVIDKDKITLESDSEQNRFVSWTIDPNNLTLSAKDISTEKLEELKEKLKEKSEKESGKGSEKGTEKEADSVSKKLTWIDMLIKAKPGSAAAKYKNGVGHMDEENAERADGRLLPGNATPIEQNLINLISAVTMQSIVNQVTARSLNMHLPVASGDDDTKMYGVWGSPFYGTANQKMQEGVSGYNMKSAGGIVGFDGLVNDNLLFGAAYSLIDTKMSHKDQKSGDKTNSRTNIFSLYGSYKFASNWFTEAVASCGITNVENLEGRMIPTNLRSVTTLETAVAKYKSISYSGQLHKFNVIPAKAGI
ncbi:autotransporter outer membrane beta-barrel domain-containing protein [Candidatus Tisiphia endosymbiont of Hybos culiciformis]|uniref:autotransporter outer membrane beta-barrel domain-containing protein n=1 Tax=Candidatus Tisiphia endosymbiont of Hybos culiciformis TaxID=3139331 RepID=UPI003CCA93F2